MNTTSTQYQYLAPNPKSSYKSFFLKGTRIRARVLYSAFVDAEDPRTPEQIAADFRVPLAAVKEAIAYVESDPPELRQDCEREDTVAQAFAKHEALSARELAQLFQR